MNAASLAAELDSIQDTAAAQRFGALLVVDNQNGLAEVVQKWLSGRRVRSISLELGRMDSSAHFEKTFRVYLPQPKLLGFVGE